jgi:hypothetical protein
MIQNLLREHRIEFIESGHHHSRDGWIQVRNCPFCNSNNYHLGFNIRLAYWNCWRCGSHYGPKVLSALGIPRSRAEQVHPHLAQSKPEQDKPRREKLVEPVGRKSLRELPRHCEYLKQRGFKPERIANLWGVQGIGLAGRLKWRLYIPVLQFGVATSWTTRAIGDVSQRYISASRDEEVVNIKQTVYGADLCNVAVVVVEGPIDAWAVGPGAGALCGTMFTTAQVQRLAQFAYRTVCFDSTHDAQRRAQKLCGLLSVFPGVTQNVVLDAKDPAEAPQRDLQRLRRAAKLC